MSKKDDIYFVKDENLWMPETSKMPPVGTVFLIRLCKDHPPIRAGEGQVYRLDRFDAKSQTMYMSMRVAVSNAYPDGWDSAHSWELQHGPTFRLFRDQHLVHGCVCDRCNGRNPYAMPNRPNGKYVCYECR